jgi:hypothetical protein
MKFQRLHVYLALIGLLLLCNLMKYFNIEGYSNSCNKKSKCNSGNSGHSKHGNGHSNNHGNGHSNNHQASDDYFNDSNYMLKTAAVPPVCPKCPDVTIDETFQRKKCPPCPPCERCPEPSFTCKKVPDYSFTNMNYLPKPMLNDFSQF